MLTCLRRLMASPSSVAAPRERQPTPTELYDQRYGAQFEEKRRWLAQRGITEPKPLIGLKVRR